MKLLLIGLCMLMILLLGCNQESINIEEIKEVYWHAGCRWGCKYYLDITYEAEFILWEEMWVAYDYCATKCGMGMVE